MRVGLGVLAVITTVKHNSLVEYYSSLAVSLHADVANYFGVSTAVVERDKAEMLHRINNEGVEFLTKTLPKLGKLLDRTYGQAAAFDPEGFEKIPGTTFPRFLGWMWMRILPMEALELDPEITTLNPDTGYTWNGATADLDDVDEMGFNKALCEYWESAYPEMSRWENQLTERDQAEPQLVKCARQFLYFAYKLELPYEDTTTQKVLDAFVSTDLSLESDLSVTADDPWLKKACALCTRIFYGFDHRDIVPKHGPGAVATGERRSGKFTFRRLYRAIERVYSFAEYFCWSLSHVCDQLDYIKGLEEMEAGTAKVVLVPKDSRGPRLISCEPLEYQWVQQGLGNKIRQWLELHPITNGHVNFTNQTINREKARDGSLHGRWVTLDMKDASDRVSLALVERLFQGTQLLEALKATRSVATRLPNGTVVNLKKFAPMGSNLCFPVEALVFWVLAVSALVTYKGMAWRNAASSVYVYGDDIICDFRDYEVIVKALESVGLLFNRDKCMTQGPFRESCGLEAFQGYDVTPVRFRTVWRHDRVVAEVVASYVAYSNALYKGGFYKAAEFVEWELQKLLADAGMRPVPYFDIGIQDSTFKKVTYEPARSRSGGSKRTRSVNLSVRLAFYRNSGETLHNHKTLGIRVRFNKRTQCEEIEGYAVSCRITRETCDGWRELLAKMNARQATIGEHFWEPEDIVMAQLHAPREGLPRGFYPVARALTLARAWTPLWSV